MLTKTPKKPLYIPSNHFWIKCRKRKINGCKFLSRARMKYRQFDGKVYAFTNKHVAPVKPTPQGYVLATIFPRRRNFFEIEWQLQNKKMKNKG